MLKPGAALYFGRERESVRRHYGSNMERVVEKRPHIPAKQLLLKPGAVSFHSIYPTTPTVGSAPNPLKVQKAKEAAAFARRVVSKIKHDTSPEEIKITEQLCRLEKVIEDTFPAVRKDEELYECESNSDILQGWTCFFGAMNPDKRTNKSSSSKPGAVSSNVFCLTISTVGSTPNPLKAQNSKEAAAAARRLASEFTRIIFPDDKKLTEQLCRIEKAREDTSPEVRKVMKLNDDKSILDMHQDRTCFGTMNSDKRTNESSTTNYTRNSHVSKSNHLEESCDKKAPSKVIDLKPAVLKKNDGRNDKRKADSELRVQPITLKRSTNGYFVEKKLNQESKLDNNILKDYNAAAEKKPKREKPDECNAQEEKDTKLKVRPRALKRSSSGYFSVQKQNEAANSFKNMVKDNNAAVGKKRKKHQVE